MIALALMLPAALAAPAADVIDVHVSSGILVPRSGGGTVPVGAVGLGTPLGDHATVRLRLLATPLDATTPKPVDGVVAWGAMLELEHRLGLNDRLDPLWIGSAGFAAADRTPPDAANFTALALHTGVGFALGLGPPPHDGSGATWTLTPILGVAPRLFAAGGLVDVVGPTLELRLGRRR